MSVNRVDQWKCSICGKIALDDGIEPDPPMNGWMQMQRVTIRSSFKSMYGPGPWEFCSNECLSKFLRKQRWYIPLLPGEYEE